jgi:hypothetical protein
MATTTPNYGWDVPTSTDYVKDGATAIETLGDDIDASLFTITNGKNVGLVHINTSSFTSAASIQIDNVFTTSFNNYRIILDTTAFTSSGNITATLRTAAPADLNAASYVYLNYGFALSTGAAPGVISSAQNQTSAVVGYVNQANNTVSIDLINAPVANPTQFNGNLLTTSASDIFNAQMTAVYRVAVAAFGVRFNFPGNTTGTVRIYGYRNS